MKKKLSLVLCMAIAAATVLSACGGNGGASTSGGGTTSGGGEASGGSSSSGKTVIRFATWDSVEDLDDQQVFVDQYNAAHDDVEVVLEAYGDDFDTKVAAGMGAKDAPDIMYMWDYPTYREGLLALDDLIAAEGADFKADYYEALWPYNSYDGVVYGMPVGFTTHVLYYNKDIFAQAGVAEPTDSWTWSDLEAAAKTITEKVDGVTGFSFPMTPDPYDYEMYYWSNGTAFCDAEGNLDGNLNSDKAVELLTMFQDMEKAGYAVATEKSGSSEFRAQSTAMFVYGSWAIGSLNEEGVNFGLANIPKFGNQTSISILSSSGLAISKDSKNVDAAWDFVKYWTGREGELFRIDYELPPMKSVVDSEDIMNDPQKAPFYKMLDQSAGYNPASFIVEGWSKVSSDLELAFEEIFNPSSLKDPKEVMDAIAK